jgi:hypothetical protein
MADMTPETEAPPNGEISAEKGSDATRLSIAKADAGCIANVTHPAQSNRIRLESGVPEGVSRKP